MQAPTPQHHRGCSPLCTRRRSISSSSRSTWPTAATRKTLSWHST
ncbi:hypothetical protein LINPERHAP1_LOCUS27979 [Linum perenne]